MRFFFFYTTLAFWPKTKLLPIIKTDSCAYSCMKPLAVEIESCTLAVSGLIKMDTVVDEDA